MGVQLVSAARQWLIELLLASCAATRTSTTQTVAFIHAAVIPMDQQRVLRDQTVLTANGRIVEIGPSAMVKVPREALRIVRGRWIGREEIDRKMQEIAGGPGATER